jgi:peptidoglycan/LPS O-acetylase OafA/YrhL
MSGKSTLLPSALAAATGIASWEIVRQLGARREAWDDPLYWQVGFPLLIVVAFVLGAVWRERPWRWGVLIVAAQAVWSLGLAFLRDGVPNLWPLGLVMFALMALPCVAAAYVGSRVGNAFSRGTPQLGA